MPTPTFTISEPRDEELGEVQRLVDAVFASRRTADAFELATQAETCDVSADAMEVVSLLPPGSYTRPQMADQLNSIITAHGWGAHIGCVE